MGAPIGAPLGTPMGAPIHGPGGGGPGAPPPGGRSNSTSIGIVAAIFAALSLLAIGMIALLLVVASRMEAIDKIKPIVTNNQPIDLGGVDDTDELVLERPRPRPGPRPTTPEPEPEAPALPAPLTIHIADGTHLTTVQIRCPTGESGNYGFTAGKAKTPPLSPGVECTARFRGGTSYKAITVRAGQVLDCSFGAGTARCHPR